MKRTRDLDAQMMAGCSLFAVVSLGCLFWSLWPFFAWNTLWRWNTVLQCLATGFVPTAVVGALASRKAGVPGAGGYVAGAIAFAVFLRLRLNQVWLVSIARQSPDLDYPLIMVALLPIAWVLFAVLVAVATYHDPR